MNSSGSTSSSDCVVVGQCRITLSSREVQVPGVRRVRRLTPKALGVLRVLLEQPGRVVSRDELFARVWPDTLPTNDVLTQAVTQLRKVFSSDDGAEPVPYIETISKTGYRLLVPVHWPQDAGTEVTPAERAALQGDDEAATAPRDAVHDDDAEQALPAPRPVPLHAPVAKDQERSGWPRALLAAVVGAVVTLILVGALLWWIPSSSPPAASPLAAAVDGGTRVVGRPERPYRIITSSAGFGTYPSISPDGTQVAYEGDRDGADGSVIKVQTTSSAPPRQLVATPAGESDRFPAWSPDGREIAFARFGAGGACAVYVASANGGELRRATRCDGADMLSFDWTPDGRGLLFGSLTGHYASRAIRRLDLATGQWRTVDYPQVNDDFDYAPRYSPDGRWIVFVRNPQMGDLWRIPAEGGTAEQLTDEAAEIRGWSWRPDSRHVVFGRRVDSEVRLYELDTDLQTLRDLGVDDGQMPAVARASGTMAFVHRRAQFALFRIPLGERDAPTLERVFASSGRDSLPMVAPDGKQLVFSSDRSGEFGLWWGQLGSPESLRLVSGVRPETRQAADWSPDSRQVLVVGRDAHGVAQVYEVQPRDERVTLLGLPVRRPLQALYTNDATRLLLVDRDRDNVTRLGLYQRDGATWRMLSSIDGVSQVRFDSNRNRVLFTRLSAGGLWSVDAALGRDSLQQIDPDRPARWRYRSWDVGADGEVRYLYTTAACPSLLTTLRAGSPVAPVCVDGERLPAGNGFSLAPDGSAAYVSLALNDGADIGVMHVMSESRTPWFPGFAKALNIKAK